MILYHCLILKLFLLIFICVPDTRNFLINRSKEKVDVLNDDNERISWRLDGMIFSYFIQLFMVKRTENQYKLRAIESIQSILGCYNSLAVLEHFTSKIQVRAVFRILSNIYHCVKSVQIWSFFWSVFSRIWTEYGISP